MSETFRLKLRDDRPATIEEHRHLRSEIVRLQSEVESKSEQIGKLYKVCNERDVLRNALTLVREIIKDGAMTGFNCHDGDWADRLFASQGTTYEALRGNQQSTGVIDV